MYPDANGRWESGNLSLGVLKGKIVLFIEHFVKVIEGEVFISFASF
jgi:hypothetical protein